MLGISYQAMPYFLLTLLVISEFSDFFDGYFARKFNQVTDLGKLLDPMADSISRTSVFLTFTQAPIYLPIWFVFVFLYRDSVVSTLRTICALRGFALAARQSGKIKAGIQAAAALLLTLFLIPATQGGMDETTLHFLAIAIVSVTALYTVYSGVDYVIANKENVFRVLKPAKTITTS